MNFQGLSHIKTANQYLDEAFRKGRATIQKTRQTIKLGKYCSKEDKSKKLEGHRLEAIKTYLTHVFSDIVASYPKFSQFDPFYKELARASLNLDAIRTALATLTWANERIESLTRMHHIRMRKAKITEVNTHRTAYLGRISSIVKQIGPKLNTLEQGRKILKSFPAIKTSVPTVVIAGYPNVGKSSLLNQLTGARPEINSYPFTTKQLMLGYISRNKRRLVQFVDSPGLLDRAKHNTIEEHALAALRHLAQVLVFVFDPTETCGYTMQQQKQLFTRIKNTFKLHTLVVFTKTDICDNDVLQTHMKSFKAYETCGVCTQNAASIARLRRRLITLCTNINQD